MVEENANKPDGLADALKYIDALVDEAVQIYELDQEKANVIDELYDSLKIITNFLGFSVDLHPALLNYPSDTRIVLTPSLDILIIKPNYKSEQKRLDEFSLDEISNIMRFTFPTLTGMATSDRTTTNKKIAFLRSASKTLKQLRNANIEEGAHETGVPVKEVER